MYVRWEDMQWWRKALFRTRRWRYYDSRIVAGRCWACRSMWCVYISWNEAVERLGVIAFYWRLARRAIVPTFGKSAVSSRKRKMRSQPLTRTESDYIATIMQTKWRMMNTFYGGSKFDRIGPHIIHTCTLPIACVSWRQVFGPRTSCHVAITFKRISIPISADPHRLLVACLDSPPTSTNSLMSSHVPVTAMKNSTAESVDVWPSVQRSALSAQPVHTGHDFI
ncbi:hypothetical protein EDB86DRAFT_523250 [Lactarius hatsudake]|nr:hypothetical protein EDB86DRAFT_523250 [Lactarius hatsudake]